LHHYEELIKLSNFESERKKRDFGQEFDLLEKATCLKSHLKRMNRNKAV
jgi:hypothetical protein